MEGSLCSLRKAQPTIPEEKRARVEMMQFFYMPRRGPPTAHASALGALTATPCLLRIGAHSPFLRSSAPTLSRWARTCASSPWGRVHTPLPVTRR